jgi:PAS domain S-box-containing protein
MSEPFPTGQPGGRDAPAATAGPRDGDILAYARRQEAVAELSRFALATDAIEQVFDRAARTVAETLGLELVEVMLRDEAALAFLVVAGVGWPDGVVGAARVDAESTLAGAVVAADGPVLAEGAAAQARYARPAHVAERDPVVSVAVPIGPPGRRVGILAGHSTEPRTVSETDVLWLRTVANVLAAALGRRQAEDRTREARDELEALIAASPVPTVAHDLEGRVTLWNPAAERTFGWTADEAIGRILPIVPPSRLDEFDAIRRRVLAGASLHGYEASWAHRDGSPVDIRFWTAPVRDAAGAVRGGVAVVQDVTADLRHEQALAFLAEASETLTSTLDYERTLARVGRLAVPALADCCVVDVVEEGERAAHALAVAHVDPAKEGLVKELEERFPSDPGAPDSFVGGVVREGRPRLVQAFDDDLLRSIARDGEHLSYLRSLRLVSGMFLPLAARGRLLGAITLLSAESGRRYDEQDLALAADLARHAALAVDNARLYRQRSHIAMTLQRSLLPPAMPAIPGVEIAARYRAAGEGIEVGGDFFDIFQTGEATWTISIGDVCGKGPEAAAVTGLARHSVRAAAIGEHSPSRLLGVVNQAVLQAFDASTFCTLAVARLDLDGQGARLTLACGGHPLPMRLAADGTISSLGRHGTLVGLFDDPVFSDETIVLAPGDALLFYTDGLVEGYGGDIERGEAIVGDLLAECAGEGAEAIADRIEGSIAEAAAAARDDVALVVVRLAQEPALKRPARS